MCSVFRHIEHTVLANVVNKQCEQLISGHDLVKRELLVPPMKIQWAIDGSLRSGAAVTPCGQLRQNDIVWLKGASCGRINWFYDYRGEMYVDVNMMAHVENDPSKFDENIAVQTYVQATAIVDALVWFYEAPSIIKVCVPAIVLLS